MLDGMYQASFMTSTLFAGNHTIVACYSGTPNYDPSEGSVVQVVGQRPITVTANAGQMKVFGTADPVFTYTVTGGPLQGGDMFTGALSRVGGESVGFYPITIGTLAISDGNGGRTIC